MEKVFVAVVALASAGTLQEIQKQIKIIGGELEEINKFDWKMIDHLINNQKTICISKKVIVDGKEFNKDYISQLLKAFSRIGWEGFYQLFSKYKTELMNQISRDGGKVNVDEMLARIGRTMEVNWEKYHESFGNYYYY